MTVFKGTQPERFAVHVIGILHNYLPQLDLIGTYTLNGRGGTALQRDPQNPVNIINTIPGGYVDALAGANRGAEDAPAVACRHRRLALH